MRRIAIAALLLTLVSFMVAAAPVAAEAPPATQASPESDYPWESLYATQGSLQPIELRVHFGFADEASREPFAQQGEAVRLRDNQRHGNSPISRATSSDATAWDAQHNVIWHSDCCYSLCFDVQAGTGPFQLECPGYPPLSIGDPLEEPFIWPEQQDGVAPTASPPEPTAASVLFEDDFSSDTGAWTEPPADYGSSSYQDGWLHVRDEPGVAETCCDLVAEDFADFIVEVDTKLIDGSDYNWHCIDVRCAEGEPLNYYSFCIGADGTYGIFRVVDDVMTRPAEGSSAHIKQGQGATNHVRVECVGDYLSLSANGNLLAEITDSSHTTGGIALGCDAAGSQFSEIAFDNLVVSTP